eukprot:scaffold6355_cov59-Phaeocystis_antarctica.AAC.1
MLQKSVGGGVTADIFRVHALITDTTCSYDKTRRHTQHTIPGAFSSIPTATRISPPQALEWLYLYVA